MTVTGGDRVYDVLIMSGPEKGSQQMILEHESDAAAEARDLVTGERVVIIKSYQIDGSVAYYIADSYRLPALLGLAALFAAAAVLFGGVRGFTSLLGLVATVIIILWYVIPRLADGSDPIQTCLYAALMITLISLYLAHGFNARTTVALIGTGVTLLASVWFAAAAVGWTRLFGHGSEDSFFLQGVGLGELDLRGLLLGGMIISVLGVLDDITTAQAAVVDELKRVNANLGFTELYARGLSVGREHIASLVNTLFLAYAGVSLPLFLLYRADHDMPLWYLTNSEMIAEEIVRTIVGSLCLVLAVPITTALAAAYFDRYRSVGQASAASGHHH